METLKEKIKKIRSQDNFPIWIIKEVLEYYDGDEDKTINKLTELYRAIGDHPDVVVKRNIENFMNEVRYSKKDNSARNESQYPISPFLY